MVRSLGRSCHIARRLAIRRLRRWCEFVVRGEKEMEAKALADELGQQLRKAAEARQRRPFVFSGRRRRRLRSCVASIGIRFNCNPPMAKGCGPRCGRRPAG